MAERPILFRAEMVRAILAGEKTCTRRPVTAGNSYVNGSRVSAATWRSFGFDFASERTFVDGGPSPAGNAGPYLHVPVTGEGYDSARFRVYPEWEPGDRLWVRETFTRGTFSGGRPWVRYRATDEKDIPTVVRWTPGIHMPRWLSRLELQVTGVRVERVQQITEEGAQAEGLSLGDAVRRKVPSTRDVFALLWDDIHGIGAFDSDPWVWVVEFKRVESSASRGGDGSPKP